MDNFFFLQENQHRSNKHPRINKVHLVTEKKKIPFFLLSCIQISHFVWVRLITTTFVEEIKQRSKNSLFKDFSKIFLPTILRKYFFKNSYFFLEHHFYVEKVSHWEKVIETEVVFFRVTSVTIVVIILSKLSSIQKKKIGEGVKSRIWKCNF